ncbi:hypothetical protein [Bifidobacterium breve]|uniref:hypothetical protein n=1 Tax=Bifidobacterium breve TaxID=1685 RepID=UPI0034A2F502
MARRNLEKPMPRPLRADAAYSRKCRRTRYNTPADANIALGRLPDDRVIRKCPECGGYHIVASGTILHRRGHGGRA